MNKKSKAIQLLIYSIGFFPIVQAACSPRTWGASLFNIPTFELTIIYSFILVFLSIACLKDIMNERYLIREQLFIFLAVIFLYAPPLISTKFGYKPYLDIVLILYFVVLCSVTLKSLKDVNSVDVLSSIKTVALVYVYGSLIATVVKFNWAVQTPYDDSIIGLNIRLYGIANHPNNLAAIAFIYIILNFIQKGKKLGSLFNLISTLIVLLMAQSKTIIIITLLLFIGIMIYRLMSVSGRFKFFSLGIFSLLMSFFIGVLYSKFSNFMLAINSGDMGDFQTFTGRNTIWMVTVQNWSLNKLFGYGNDLWDEQMQREYQIVAKSSFIPYHSHNQFFQTLGTSGIIGVLGLFLFVIVIIFSIMRLKGMNRYGLMLFALSLFIRGFTEPVLSNEFNDGNFFILFSFLLTIIVLSKDKSSNNIV